MAAGQTEYISANKIKRRNGWTPEQILEYMGEPDKMRDGEGLSELSKRMYSIQRYHAIRREIRQRERESSANNGRNGKQSRCR